ncbi:alpha/beta hydrolase family protein [Compostibacter hankyongensis]|uniref:Acetyl xylan esterase domain-containing protein n=1 Tax=Compostibacter hankyongensis TaxID=1007089 RepID=A0ABP8FWC7_9BACT
MHKGILVTLVITLSVTGCTTSNRSPGPDSTAWSLPDRDPSQLPPASYSALTALYDTFQLKNRDVTFRDERLLTMRGIDNIYQMPAYSLEDWKARKQYLREHILVCAGLWPMPEKTPLHPKYYYTKDHGDYIVRTVTLETHPGFFLGANIYEPKGKGPFPAILCPHGHFEYGRLTNDSITSIPGRCINFARQGYVVMAYDMAGYNDTRQVTHRFADDSISGLYGINLLGLQLWNSIRAMDFLFSLPEVDTSRTAITGASGGGTQAFLFTAVDDRFQVAAPVNMVSDHMQGGDLCENAPGLRVNTFNVEIASMTAPKPLLLVSDTHDWTQNTRQTILPMVRSVYQLYGATDKLKNAHFDYPHNYNKASREAVYQWFGRWLLHENDSTKFREKPFTPDPDKDLLAFMNGRNSDRQTPFARIDPGQYHDLPGTLDEEGLKRLLKNIFSRQLKHSWPEDGKRLKEFKAIYGTACRHLLEAAMPEAVTCRVAGSSKGENFIATRLLISAKDQNKWIPCVLYQPLLKTGSTVILTADEGKSHWVGKGRSVPDKTISKLLSQRFNVLVADLFNQGEHVLQDSTMSGRDESLKYFTTYNLTDRQEQILDILTIIRALDENKALSGHIGLYATGSTGMTGLLAAALTDRLDKTVVDADHFDPAVEKNMLDLQIPGIMRIGGLESILALLMDRHLLIYRASPSLSYPGLAQIRKIEGNQAHLTMTPQTIDDDQVIDFLKP